MITEIEVKCDDPLWVHNLYRVKDPMKISVDGVEVEVMPTFAETNVLSNYPYNNQCRVVFKVINRFKEMKDV